MQTRTLPVAGVPDDAADISELLLARRQALLAEIHGRARDVREESATHRTPRPALDEDLDAYADDDVAFTIIQMRVEMLQRVDEAVRRCEAGTYGQCLDCGTRIAAARLRALPFAVRCRGCQQRREDLARDARRVVRAGTAPS